MGGAAVVYDSTVTRVGGQVESFLDAGVMVFFAASAPAELQDIAVLHEVRVADDGPRPGDVVSLGDVELPVLSVGAVVRDNLLGLGHLDLKADGRTEPALPGDVSVPEGPLPLPVVGDRFRVLRPAGGAGTGP